MILIIHSSAPMLVDLGDHTSTTASFDVRSFVLVFAELAFLWNKYLVADPPALLEGCSTNNFSDSN